MFPLDSLGMSKNFRFFEHILDPLVDKQASICSGILLYILSTLPICPFV
jgi:hypothetical protein